MLDNAMVVALKYRTLFKAVLAGGCPLLVLLGVLASGRSHVAANDG